jgi:hypothetical protein
VANRASTLPTTAGALAFPNGGEMLNVPALVSSEVAPGRLHLIDAGGIAAAVDDAITIETSTRSP